ncbi:MAG: hypothetical protein ACLRVT_09040, partial [Oscillospiraceae bacterium]
MGGNTRAGHTGEKKEFSARLFKTSSGLFQKTKLPPAAKSIGWQHILSPQNYEKFAPMAFPSVSLSLFRNTFGHPVFLAQPACPYVVTLFNDRHCQNNIRKSKQRKEANQYPVRARRSAPHGTDWPFQALPAIHSLQERKSFPQSSTLSVENPNRCPLFFAARYIPGPFAPHPGLSPVTVPKFWEY